MQDSDQGCRRSLWVVRYTVCQSKRKACQTGSATMVSVRTFNWWLSFRTTVTYQVLCSRLRPCSRHQVRWSGQSARRDTTYKLTDGRWESMRLVRISPLATTVVNSVYHVVKYGHHDMHRIVLKTRLMINVDTSYVEHCEEMDKRRHQHACIQITWYISRKTLHEQLKCVFKHTTYYNSFLQVMINFALKHDLSTWPTTFTQRLEDLHLFVAPPHWYHAERPNTQVQANVDFLWVYSSVNIGE